MSFQEDPDDADEQEEEEPQETVIHVEMPKVSLDLGNQIHFVKFPNFLSVEPRCAILHIFKISS